MKASPMESVYNIRPVDANGLLYRSARHDVATPGDIRKLRQLGIRTFLDFRNAIEYRNSMGGRKKIIDDEVQVVVPTIPDPRSDPYPTLNSVPLTGLNGKPVAQDAPRPTGTNKPKRYLVDVVCHHLLKQIFQAAPLLKRLYFVLLYIVDIILGNHFKYSLRVFAAEISRAGMYGRYVDILEHSGKALCFILKALSDPENLPAIISCAHGKDRTGVVTALVLGILEKSDEYIVEDYAMSQDGLKPICNEVVNEIVLKYKLDEEMAMASKETMIRLLETIRERYGSIENYLESIGFNRADQDRLRSVLSQG